MSEEQLPQQPVVPESIQPTPIPVEATPKIPVNFKNPSGSDKGRRGTLESLPTEVKEDMESYMKRVNPHASRKYMVEKYGEQFPKIKELSPISFNAYFKRHNVKISRELILQKESAPPPQEILDVINKITDPDISLADKRNALTALFNACEARSKMLQERQTNFIDPAIRSPYFS